MCLVSKNTAVGDTICVFFGLDMPFVIRREDDYYILIGQCYVEGETINYLEEGRFGVT
ncbi:uncharacterized protein K444DRAFT_614992 [Hyaloscypha bicolor E]|uniref:Heterokaryon incompatibility domain-containing protein n=1 Tax=Hyaloscypha bicolor E TaxID=1095630 RepID=A0A2J6T3H8_9HELO|nr:uncharacterized protein K444DRAFT_614992 [Hyaloscypha bicolor E]PMD57590.1 hypothetical protein K444DRAFT_614992 [Hyaloscypha bicolor E]